MTLRAPWATDDLGVPLELSAALGGASTPPACGLESQTTGAVSKAKRRARAPKPTGQPRASEPLAPNPPPTLPAVARTDKNGAPVIFEQGWKSLQFDVTTLALHLRLDDTQLRVLVFVLCKTLGFGKPTENLSNAAIAAAIRDQGARAKHASRAVRQLESKGVLFVQRRFDSNKRRHLRSIIGASQALIDAAAERLAKRRADNALAA